MFNDYAKKLEALGDNVPKTFKRVAQKGANHFEKTAKQNTDLYGLVDTGNYKGNWWANTQTVNDAQVIKVGNDVEYASHLEDGYSIEKRHFVPFEQMKGTPKANKFIADFKSRYPNAKGFIAKPRRFKGMKIGRISLDNTEAWTIQELRAEIEALMLSKKTGVSRGEAMKIINS